MKIFRAAGNLKIFRQAVPLYCSAFATKLTQARLRALRSYLGKDGRYRAPKETTFQRVLSNLDPDAFERILHAWETQLLGPSETSGDKLTAIGGKAQCGSSPEVKNEQQSQLVSAQSLPSGRVLGTVLVETKSNEITAARELLEKIGAGDAKLIDAAELLRDARLYWQIEGGLHQGLDVSAREDSSRVRNRNALRVLGMARRRMMGPYRDWRDRRKNKPQSTLADVYDAMSGHNNRGAWQKIISLG